MRFNLLFEEIVKDYSFENTNTKAMFVFGRMNPPTIGHAMLLRKADEMAAADDRELFVFLSKTSPNTIEQSRVGKTTQKTHRVNAQKNPLEFDYKIELLNSALPHIRFISDEMATNPFNAGYWLRDHGFKDVVLLAGSDRIAQYEGQFNKYISHEDPELSMRFENFEVRNAGSRDPDSDDAVSAASGTAARELAIAGDYDNLQKILIPGIPRNKIIELAEIIKNVDDKYSV